MASSFAKCHFNSKTRRKKNHKYIYNTFHGIFRTFKILKSLITEIKWFHLLSTTIYPSIVHVINTNKNLQWLWWECVYQASRRLCDTRKGLNHVPIMYLNKYVITIHNNTSKYIYFFILMWHAHVCVFVVVQRAKCARFSLFKITAMKSARSTVTTRLTSVNTGSVSLC